MNKLTELIYKLQEHLDKSTDDNLYIIKSMQEIADTMAYFLQEVYADDVVEIIPDRQSKQEIQELLNLWQDVKDTYNKLHKLQPDNMFGCINSSARTFEKTLDIAVDFDTFDKVSNNIEEQE